MPLMSTAPEHAPRLSGAGPGNSTGSPSLPFAPSVTGGRRKSVRVAIGFCVLALSIVISCGEKPPAPAPKSDRGLSYFNERVRSVPWSVHVVQVERGEPTLGLQTMLARRTVLGLGTVSEQAASVPASWGLPVAAVNGDFYQRENSSYAGDPRGLQIVNGELVSAPGEQAAFWLDADGQPHATNVMSRFRVSVPGGKSYPLGLNEERTGRECVLYTPTLGKATRNRGGTEWILERNGSGPWLPLRIGENYSGKVREIRKGSSTPLAPDIVVLAVGANLASNVVEVGSLVEFSTETLPSLKGATVAIGGGSIVTLDGKRARIEAPNGMRGGYSVSSMYERHPRAMMGWSKTHFFLAEVDGRQRGLSAGMTLEEVGAYMAKLGCDTALSLDGGGSATMWYAGKVVNSPCDGVERPVANSLIVVRKEKAKAAASP